MRTEQVAVIGLLVLLAVPVRAQGVPPGIGAIGSSLGQTTPTPAPVPLPLPAASLKPSLTPLPAAPVARPAATAAPAAAAAAPAARAAQPAR